MPSLESNSGSGSDEGENGATGSVSEPLADAAEVAKAASRRLQLGTAEPGVCGARHRGQSAS